ncbi:hypothetical protein [Flavobacterium sp. 14A]|uniref:hypothetical protein n=1 Tax=Flavobacterium sp. 14A TaxID=2735896 RepID=UPI001570110F|nr:hypothetical protein [Flavobacterium sp. 14A]NRT11442.1 hypothetical protein [Flavobacterium sp. 14A]
MKKSKGVIGLFIVFISLIFACSGENQSEASLVKKVVETTEDGKETATVYTYEGDLIKTIDAVATLTTFTYTQDLITKKSVLDKKSKKTVITTYTYDKDQLLEAKTASNGVIYTQKGKDTISFEHYDLDADNKQKVLFTGLLIFEKGNLAKEERTTVSNDGKTVEKETVDYEYDDKVNPLAAAKGFVNLLDYKEIASANNVTIIAVTNSKKEGDQEISAANLYMYSYTYDEKGKRPTEQITSDVRPQNGKSGALKTTYFYNE